MVRLPRPWLSRPLLALAAAASLHCGGGGGGSSPTPQPTTAQVTVRVVDGPIRNVVVCLDANGNGSCDAGEVQGTTDVAGNATLAVPPADVGKYPVVAVVGTNAVDADNGPVTTAFVLKAPADQTAVVTPLTTLVQAHVEATGVATATASAFIQAQAGLPVSPLVDFSTATGAGATQAAVLARLVVLTTQEQASAIAGAVVGQVDLSGATVTPADLQRAIASAIVSALPTLAATASAAAAAPDANAALASAAQDLVSGGAVTSADEALATIGLAKLPAEPAATAAPAPSASFRAFTYTDANNWYYRAMLATAADNTPDASGFVHYYDFHAKDVAGTVTTWGLNNDPARQGDLHWNGSAWVGCPLGFRNTQTPRDAQGRTTFDFCDGLQHGTTVRSAVDVSGQTLSSVVAQKIRTFPGGDSGVSYASWGPVDLSLLGTATFPAGSKLFYQSQTPTDFAIAYDVLPAAIVSTSSAAVAAGGDARTGTPACVGPVTPSTTATLEDLVALNPGTPCVFAQGSDANGTSLSPNESWTFTTATLGVLANAVTRPLGTGNFYTTNQVLKVAFGTGQTARYYGCFQRALNGFHSNCSLLGSGTYAIQTLGDARVLTFTNLPAASQRLGFSRVFVERGGKVMFAFRTTPVVTNELRMNLTAANAILTQLGLAPIAPN